MTLRIYLDQWNKIKCSSHKKKKILYSNRELYRGNFRSQGEIFLCDDTCNNIFSHCSITGNLAYFLFFTIKIVLSRILAILGPSFFHIHFRISFPWNTKNCGLFVFGRNGTECLLTIHGMIYPSILLLLSG